MSNNQGQYYESGGANNTTGREPFGDSTSTGHSGTSHNFSGSNTNTGSQGVGHHLVPESSGNIKAGTSADKGVGHGTHTGDELLNSGIRSQTGDEYGGLQTGSTKFGTGHNVSSEGNRSIIDKAKDILKPHTGQNVHNTGAHVPEPVHSGSGTSTAQYGDVPASTTTTTTHSHSGVGAGAAGVGAGLAAGHQSHSHEHEHRDHHHSGTGVGIGSAGTHGDNYRIAETGTLGQGTSTTTKQAPTGVHNFDEEPIDSTTGQRHHFHTVSGGEYSTGTGSGITSGSGLTSGSHYGSNTSASEYERNTSGLTSGSGPHYDNQGDAHKSSIGAKVDSAAHKNTSGSTTHYDNQGDAHKSSVAAKVDSAAHGSGRDTSAGYGRDGGVGNSGVAGHQGGIGGLSSGAAGTDRFDTDRTTSGTGAQYGNDVGEKHSNDHKLSGLTRHGDDFTGGDTAEGAYSNPASTGLTGRESTTTGVHDQHGNSTAPHKEGLLDKVKSAVGLGHANTKHADA